MLTPLKSLKDKIKEEVKVEKKEAPKVEKKKK